MIAKAKAISDAYNELALGQGNVGYYYPLKEGRK